MSDQKKSGERGLGADRVEEGYGATTPGSSKPAAQQRGALSQSNSPPQQRSSHPTQHSPQLYSYGQYPHAGQVGGSSQQPHVGSAPAYYHQQSHLAPQRQLPHSMYNPRSSSRQVTPDERQYLYSGYRSPIGSSLQRTLHSPADSNRSPTKRPRQSSEFYCCLHYSSRFRSGLSSFALYMAMYIVFRLYVCLNWYGPREHCFFDCMVTKIWCQGSYVFLLFEIQGCIFYMELCARNFLSPYFFDANRYEAVNTLHDLPLCLHFLFRAILKTHSSDIEKAKTAPHFRGNYFVCWSLYIA
jgi:hypothetical protein